MTTVSQIIQPFGKGSAAIRVGPIFEDLCRRYLKNIRRHIKLFYFEIGDSHVIAARIPSERNGKLSKDIFYDCVIEFVPHDKKQKEFTSVRDYDVAVYSNCPSFIFTFTNAFAREKALTKLIPKSYYMKRALKERADERNPQGLLGIDKSLWFTFRYMTQENFFRKNRLRLIQSSKSWDEYVKTIATQEEKYKESSETPLKKQSSSKKGGGGSKSSTSTNSSTLKSNLKSATKPETLKKIIRTPLRSVIKNPLRRKTTKS